MKTKETQRKWRQYLPLLLSGTVLIVAVVIVVIAAVGGLQSDTYKMVRKAIDNTESMKDYLVHVSSSSLITGDGISQQTDTEGYICRVDELGLTYIHANTAGNRSDDPSADFDVTVAMYSDGEHVYDNSTGKDEIIEEISCAEFDEIVSEYELYRYNEADVVDVAFAENKMEGMENNGDLTVTLSKPSKAALDALAEGMATATGEAVDADDLTVVAASVTYSIYEEMVAGQTCSFTVRYQRSDGETVQLASSTHLLYSEFGDDEDVDTYIPIEKEDAA